MSLLLDPNSVSLDEDFKYACDDSEARLFVENLWNCYREYADKDFAKKIPMRFHDHFWEMYLACSLKDNGNNLLPKTKPRGPDIEIKSTDFSSIWVEATTASPGSSEDRVPLPKLDDKMWFRVPEERIVLRYTTVIDAKYKKFIQYTNGNVIAKSEPYIIAVNGSKVPYSWDLSDEIPYIVQAVLQSEIKKVSGEKIPTNIFFRKEYEGISGIIFSRVDIRQFHSKMGRDFIFIHNPLALNTLPEGWLRMGREYRAEGNSLVCRRWSK